jgi:hypothetical protein
MRWLLTMALLAIMASPALAQENEAEKLVRSMAQRVRAAKTLRLRFDLSVTDSDAKTGTLKGALILGEGDKFWAQGEGKPFDKAVKFTIVNDGVTMKTTGSTPKQEKTENSPKTVGIYLRRTLPRAGFFVCFSTIDRLEDLESDPFKMAEFKLAGQEKIGTRNTQAIQWIVTENGKKTV